MSRVARNVTSLRHRRKALLVEYKGGSCERCGYNRCLAALVFHHRVPSAKAFTLSGPNYQKTLDTLHAEADKCDLLCANCHAEVHEELVAERKAENSNPTRRSVPDR